MAENARKLNYSVLSARRNDLFGISIVSIVIFHFYRSCQSAHVYVNGANTFIALIGRVGVPIFLMLSGMGLFFSLSKNGSLKEFYKRRFTRLLVPYFIISVAHYFIRYILLQGKGFLAMLKGIFFVEFFTKGITQFWFVALLIIMYALFPLLFKLFRSGKYSFLKLVIVVGVVVGINVLLYQFAPKFYRNTSILLSRIPAFIVGVYLGEKVYNKKPVQWPFWAITFTCSVVFLVFSIRCYLSGIKLPSSIVFVYFESLYALFWMMVIAIVLDAVNSAPFSKVCGFFGVMSMELYMVHVSFRGMMRLLGFVSYNPLYYTVMAVIAVVICFFLQKFDAFAIRKLTTKHIHTTLKKDS